MWERDGDPYTIFTIGGASDALIGMHGRRCLAVATVDPQHDALMVNERQSVAAIRTSLPVGLEAPLMTSLCMRTSAPHPWSNNVGNHKAKRPCEALRQMGRIERTLFTLDWIHDEQLRKTTTAELNKGKSRNSLVPAGRTL
jgi:hypothetical protein